MQSLSLIGLAWWGICGLCIGSFVHVVATRLPLRLLDDAAFNNPRSECAHCKRNLPWWALVPVLSWLALKGRSACCQQPIALSYPLVELLTAVWFVWCGYAYAHTSQVLAATVLWSVWGAALLCCLLIDYKYFLLPNVLTYSLLALGLAASAAPIIGLRLIDTSLMQSVTGAAGAWLSLSLVAWVYKGVTGRDGMGQGDIKLFAALGAWLGLAALPWVLLGASLAGSVVGLVQRQQRTQAAQETQATAVDLGLDPAAIAFGPYLVVSAVAYQVWQATRTLV